MTGWQHSENTRRMYENFCVSIQLCLSILLKKKAAPLQPFFFSFFTFMGENILHETGWLCNFKKPTWSWKTLLPSIQIIPQFLYGVRRIYKLIRNDCLLLFNEEIQSALCQFHPLFHYHRLSHVNVGGERKGAAWMLIIRLAASALLDFPSSSLHHVGAIQINRS